MRGQSFGFVSFSAFVIEKKGWNTMKHPLTGSPDGKPLVSLLILAVGFSWNAPAAPSAAGYREALNLSVPTATTSNVSDRLWVSEGTLNKLGGGTLAVSASNLIVQSSGQVAVRSGTLTVSGDSGAALAPAPCPTEVMAQAAFWVDASQNVIAVSSNGNTYADAWLDVRETNPSGPYTYVRAVANWNYVNCSPQVVTHTGPNGDQPSIWFAGYGSRRTMNWKTPSDNLADIGNMCHVFLLHGVFVSNGFILGIDPNRGVSDFHISDLGGGSPYAPIWNPQEWSTTAVRQGRTYLDGERVDGTVVFPKIGWQLLEVAFDVQKAHASNF